MRRIALLMVLAVLVVAGRTNAAKLLIFSDSGFTDSTLTDDSPRIVNLYVVHTSFNYSSGVRFATSPGAGFTGVLLGESSSHASIGQSETDIAVAYDGCMEPPVLVLTMTYEFFGTSQPCSHLGIVPPDAIGVILCDAGCFAEGTCSGGRLNINCAVATEPSTWGRVKALYRN